MVYSPLWVMRVLYHQQYCLEDVRVWRFEGGGGKGSFTPSRVLRFRALGCIFHWGGFGVWECSVGGVVFGLAFSDRAEYCRPFGATGWLQD